METKHPRDGNGDAERGYGAIAKSEIERTPRAPRRSTGTLGADWMADLDDDLPLSALTIPGTHDSSAFTYSWPFVATQKMDFLQQLNAGIRYFDLRCGVRNDVVEMVHGPTYLGLRLERVLETMYRWLSAHSSEALVVQIKQDRDEEKSTAHFSHAIFKELSQKSERWRTANTTPSLGELRGRIQLFRRFEGPTLYAYGINVSRWVDNPTRPFTIYTRHCVQVTIQDHYSFPDPESLPSLIAKKGGDVSGLLDHAFDDLDQKHWYINFTSAYEFNLYYQLPPREVAVGGWWGFRWENGMNVRLRGYLREKGKGMKRFGIVAMDFPEAGVDDLIAALIQTNFESDKDSLWHIWTLWLPALLLLAILATGMCTMRMHIPSAIGFASSERVTT